MGVIEETEGIDEVEEIEDIGNGVAEESDMRALEPFGMPKGALAGSPMPGGRTVVEGEHPT
ncbi:hypothetical protein [Embleya sp. NPDC059237]|uniref:hypothetical protein n=1 Tax=Embleya sp. NPDC059237 TaxID=3346784 RepID=UPI003696DFFF